MINFENYKQKLKEFVALKSISTDPKYNSELAETAIWIKNLLKSSGFKTSIWKAKFANPIVFAQYIFDSKKETVLIYGHYDVQPANKRDGWNQNPFVLNEKKGKLIARGVVDNKGQILAHVLTAARLIQKGNLKYNIKFLIEGNEESGSGELLELIPKYKKELKCNFVLISDGELTNGSPTIEVSLRGGFNATLNIRTGKTNVHSGIFGGAIPNAAHELTSFLDKLISPDGTIKYQEFYKNVDVPTSTEIRNNKNLSRYADIKNLAGVNSLCLPKNKDFFTQTGLYPTIQVTGMASGYTAQGYANIVPNEAELRLNFRIVASQKPESVSKKFEGFVKKSLPKYVDYKLSFSGLHNPIKVETNNQYISRVEKTLKEVYKTNVVRKNVGGAIPFVADVKEILGVDTLLIPLCNEDCNMHGVDENFDISLIKKALEFSERFLSV